MDEGIGVLALAALVFVGSHIWLSHGPVRRALVARLGLWPYRAVYSLISTAALLWLIDAYQQAPVQVIIDASIRLKHMPLSLMLFASLLIVGGYTIANPSALLLQDIKSDDKIPTILKVTRAPVMWGVALFAFSHMLANPHVAAWILFGALLVLAIFGGWHLDRRKLDEGSEKWQKLAEQTSFWPLAALITGRAKIRLGDLSWWRIALGLALYSALLAGHRIVIGVGPFPLPD